MTKTVMQAPKGVTEAVIEGHTYAVPKDRKVRVISDSHIPTLLRHGFTESTPEYSPEELEKIIEDMDEKDALIAFIEEHGGEADDSMGFKKLKRLAREAVAATQED
jgi:hypothetical protein